MLLIFSMYILLQREESETWMRNGASRCQEMVEETVQDRKTSASDLFDSIPTQMSAKSLEHTVSRQWENEQNESSKKNIPTTEHILDFSLSLVSLGVDPLFVGFDIYFLLHLPSVGIYECAQQIYPSTQPLFRVKHSIL